MKYFYLEGSFEDKTPESLIKFLNENEGPITVFINSGGGKTWTGNILTRIINENKDRIKIIACCAIYSAAFELFFKCECEREIMPGTLGMYHYAAQKFSFGENGKFSYEDESFIAKSQNKKCPETIKFCEKLGMTKKEINKIKKNDDLYISYERLMELLDRQKKELS